MMKILLRLHQGILDSRNPLETSEAGYSVKSLGERIATDQDCYLPDSHIGPPRKESL